jgi:predicted O-methyltransferase YrrM
MNGRAKQQRFNSGDQMPASISAITETIEEMLSTGRGAGDDGKSVNISAVAVSRNAGRVLEEAASVLAPAACLEVGCASAMSTLHICRGRLRAGPVPPQSMHVMDPKQTKLWRNAGRRALSRGGLLDEDVVFYEEPAHAVLPRLLAERTRLQFAFIDGWHTLDHVMVEAFYCDRMLDLGGLIGLHDLWMPGLQAFACFWCTNRYYEPVTLHDGRLTTEPATHPKPGLGDSADAFPGFKERLAPYVDHSVLLLRKTGVDLRRWDYFRQFWLMPQK